MINPTLHTHTGSPSTSWRHTPWLWIPSLSAAEEIPTAVVTFVSLLMFLQFGLSDTWASLLCALLFLPPVLKPRLIPLLLRVGHFKQNIHIAEALLFCTFISIALYLNYFPCNPILLFALLLLVSSLCSVHGLLARLYYDSQLPPLQQRLYDKTRIFASQTTLILTYGILIISVGFLEIFFRSIPKAWATESYLVAGAFLLFALLNLLVMPPLPSTLGLKDKGRRSKVEGQRLSSFPRPSTLDPRPSTFDPRPSTFDLRPSTLVLRPLPLFLLLLPQALMFNTRVFFLLAAPSEGGLGCSLQDVGFAQGTIGVIAFSVGILLGRLLRSAYGPRRTFWWLAVPLTLSPLFYMLMSQHPPIGHLTSICCMTFLAQFCFGLGLNLISPRPSTLDPQPSTLVPHPSPLLAMLPAIALSGWLESLIGFRAFFLLDASLALPALLVLKRSRVESLGSRAL